MGASKKWLKTIVSKKLSHRAKNSGNEQSPDKKQEQSPRKKPSKWNPLKSCRVIDKGLTRDGGVDDGVANGGSGSGKSAKASRRVLSQAEREEWAAICIQTAFRGFLARKTLRALRGLVRLHAAINGKRAQKQSIESLRSIQSFVRTQAKIRAHRALKNKGVQGVPKKVSSHSVESRPEESEEDGWCDTIGSVEEIQARAQQRQEAAIKRERALAYAFSNQWQPNSRLNLESLFDYQLDNSSWSWIWLDRWINNQPNNRNLTYKLDAQALDSTGMPMTLKKSASHKSVSSPDTQNCSEFARAQSHGAATGVHLSFASKPNGNKHAQKLNTEQLSTKQERPRSLSAPKQRPSKEVKWKSSLPSPDRDCECIKQ